MIINSPHNPKTGENNFNELVNNIFL